jgi:hypothetical protein
LTFAHELPPKSHVETEFEGFQRTPCWVLEQHAPSALGLNEAVMLIQLSEYRAWIYGNVLELVHVSG